MTVNEKRLHLLVLWFQDDKLRSKRFDSVSEACEHYYNVAEAFPAKLTFKSGWDGAEQDIFARGDLDIYLNPQNYEPAT